MTQDIQLGEGVSLTRGDTGHTARGRCIPGHVVTQDIQLGEGVSLDTW